MPPEYQHHLLFQTILTRTGYPQNKEKRREEQQPGEAEGRETTTDETAIGQFTKHDAHNLEAQFHQKNVVLHSLSVRLADNLLKMAVDILPVGCYAAVLPSELPAWLLLKHSPEDPAGRQTDLVTT